MFHTLIHALRHTFNHGNSKRSTSTVA